MSEKLLMTAYLDALGKTHLEISKELKERTKGVHTFGDICANSDEIVKDRRKPQSFMEHGIAGNAFLAVQILKAPIFKLEGDYPELIGTMGVGRDVTPQWLEHEQIENLLAAGKFDDALKTFREHKLRFESILMELNNEKNGPISR